MRSEKEIRDKLKEIEDGLIKYKKIFDDKPIMFDLNGLPINVESTPIYIQVKGQVDSLYWVLGEKTNKGI